jgi:predicted DNA-binding protein
MKHLQLPKRAYTKKPKKLFSIRLPADLIQRLQEISEDMGYSTSEVIQSVLDDFCQQVTSAPKKK